MKQSQKVFIIALLVLLPLNSVLALAMCPPWICPPPPPPTSDPVIVIPGIMGSWNWSILFRDSAPTLDNWSFPPLTNVYEPLLNALRTEYANQGLDPDKNVFVAFYD